MSDLPEKSEIISQTPEKSGIEASVAELSSLKACRLFHRWGPWRVVEIGCSIQQHRNCLRCGRLATRDIDTAHVFGPWELYEVTQPSHITEPSLKHIKEEKETWQRRRCKNCGWHVDELVRKGPSGTRVESKDPGDA